MEVSGGEREGIFFFLRFFGFIFVYLFICLFICSFPFFSFLFFSFLFRDIYPLIGKSTLCMHRGWFEVHRIITKIEFYFQIKSKIRNNHNPHNDNNS